jgi:hypothetical protein
MTMETHVAKFSAAGTNLAASTRALEDLPAATHIVEVDAEGVFPFVALPPMKPFDPDQVLLAVRTAVDRAGH